MKKIPYHHINRRWTLLILALFLLPASISLAQPIKELTVNQAAQAIAQFKYRKPVVVLIYSVTCPHCQKFLPVFDGWLRKMQGKNIAVLAFSTNRNSQTLSQYFSKQRPSFELIRMQPWKPGDLSKAMAKVGVKIGKTFGQPLVAVINTLGQNVGQWSGRISLGQIEAAVVR